MAKVPIGISVSVQYEYLHTVLYKPFFISLSVSFSVSVSVNAPLTSQKMMRSSMN